jgi:hypothetical protein
MVGIGDINAQRWYHFTEQPGGPPINVISSNNVISCKSTSEEAFRSVDQSASHAFHYTSPPCFGAGAILQSFANRGRFVLKSDCNSKIL